MTVVTASLLMGGLVGLVLALTGAGGGILAVPLLVFGLHMSMVQAAPVGLLAVGLASGIGAVLGLREGLVRYRAAAIIGVVGMVCAPLGIELAHQLPNAPLMLAFSGVLAWVAWRSLRPVRRPADDPGRSSGCRRPCQLDPSRGRLVLTPRCIVALAGTGALSGLLSGLLGVGGGFVIVPALTSVSNVSMRGIISTSLAVIALVSVGGVVGAASRGAIDWVVALPFAIGSAAALLAGRVLSARVASVWLQRAFGMIAAFVAVVLMLRGLNGLDH